MAPSPSPETSENSASVMEAQRTRYAHRHMDKLAVVANPVASQFTGGDYRDVMAALNRGGTVEGLWPSSAADASVVSRQAAEDGAEVVLAMGGDGLVHHVAQGLIGTDTALGIIPAGTTNVIGRLFGIPSNPVKAAKLVMGEPIQNRIGTVRMDLTRGKTQSTHHALFACGLGLDADVVIEADKDPYKKYRFGSLHYATTTFGVALKSFPKKRPHVSVQSGDRSAEATAVVFQFRDVYTYFGRLPITLSKDDPNPLTALIMGRLKRRRVPAIASKVFLRRDLDELKEVDIWQDVESLTATARPPVAAQADGESLGMVNGAVISWQADSLTVLGAQASA